MDNPEKELERIAKQMGENMPPGYSYCIVIAATESDGSPSHIGFLSNGKQETMETVFKLLLEAWAERQQSTPSQN